MTAVNEFCPHCGESLTAEEIPPEYRSEDGRTHYSHIIGMEIRGVYDGVLFWMCPFCGGKWHRFGLDHFLRVRAEKYVTE
jgi:rRNA maturation protein Nop10